MSGILGSGESKGKSRFNFFFPAVSLSRRSMIPPVSCHVCIFRRHAVAILREALSNVASSRASDHKASGRPDGGVNTWSIPEAASSSPGVARGGGQGGRGSFAGFAHVEEEEEGGTNVGAWDGREGQRMPQMLLLPWTEEKKNKKEK